MASSTGVRRRTRGAPSQGTLAASAKARGSGKPTEPAGPHMSAALVLKYTVMVFVFEAGVYFSLLATPLPHRAVLFIVSSTAGLVHSTHSMYCAVNFFRRPFQLNSRNDQTSINMFSFTFAYFIFDAAFVYAVDYPGAMQFVGHHIASAVVVLSCSAQGYGDMTLNIWYLLGEASNAPQNLYIILEILEEQQEWYSAAAGAGAAVFRPLFLCLFIVLRVVISPPVYLYMVHQLLAPGAARYHPEVKRCTIKRRVAVLWCVGVGGILVGSYQFIAANLHFLDGMLHGVGLSHLATAPCIV